MQTYHAFNLQAKLKQMRCKYLLIILLLFSAPTYSQDTIYWKFNYKLKWEDFQGIPDSTSTFGALSFLGTYYNSFYQNGQLITKVFTYFNKKKSWSRQKDDTTFIHHEQGHFDISELYARLFRKSIATHRFTNEQVDSTFRALSLEKRKFQELYDIETDLSRNRKKQFFWSRKILMDIKKLDNFRE